MSLFDLGEHAKRLLVWSKGIPIPNLPSDEWRYDAFNSVMRFSHYANRQSECGWELDHYPVPAAIGGSDDPSNLRPLHWRNNASHGGLLGNLLMGMR